MTAINYLEIFDPRERSQEDEQLQNAGSQQQPNEFIEDAENEYMQEGDLEEDAAHPDSDEL